MPSQRVEFFSEIVNGSLRVILVPRSHSLTVACRAFVKCGSRHDGDRHGLAHLLEHMLFRGTRHRPAEELFQVIEGVGGKIRVTTGKEYTCAGFVVPAQELERGLEVVADVLSNPLFPAAAFEEEKVIIANEIAATRDQQQVLWDLLASTLWLHHPLRHPIGGNGASLAAIELADLQAHYHRYFQPCQSVVVIAGDIEPKRCLQAMRQCFDVYRDDGKLPEMRVAESESLERGREAHLEKDTHQSHLVLAWPIGGVAMPERHIFKLLESILGQGGSSRLYRKLRTNGGFVYGVATNTTLYEDVGYFAIHTTCDPKDLATVRQIILAEVEALGRKRIELDELHNAQRQYEGALLVNFESNYSLAGLFGANALLYRAQSFEELRERVRQITVEEVLTTASSYLGPDRCVSVTVGRQPV